MKNSSSAFVKVMKGFVAFLCAVIVLLSLYLISATGDSSFMVLLLLGIVGLLLVFLSSRKKKSAAQSNAAIQAKEAKPVATTKTGGNQTVTGGSQTVLKMPQTQPCYVGTLLVHPDLNGLIWVKNGPMKNIDRCPQINPDYHFDSSNLHLSFNSTKAEEPSAIDVFLPVTEAYQVNPLGYYPAYADISPEQRYCYLKFLQNPYDQTADIGYAFLLLYGLERHLFLGDFERAFHVILKLREVFSNHSFRSYSYDALLLSCLKQSRRDYLEKLLWTDSSNIKLSVVVKSALQVPLTSKELMSYRNVLHFTPVTYIKDRPDEFEEELTNVFMEHYGQPAFPAHLYCFPRAGHDLDVITSNYSMQVHLQIADPFSDEQFFKVCTELLSEAHQRLKKRLAEERKKK